VALDVKELLERVAEITQRADDSTDGPWVPINGHEADDAKIQTIDGRVVALMVWEYDAPFIATARSDIPYLCAAVRELAKVIERVIDSPSERDKWLSECYSVLGKERPRLTRRALPSPPQEAAKRNREGGPSCEVIEPFDVEDGAK